MGTGNSSHAEGRSCRRCGDLGRFKKSGHGNHQMQGSFSATCGAMALADIPPPKILQIVTLIWSSNKHEHPRTRRSFEQLRLLSSPRTSADILGRLYRAFTRQLATKHTGRITLSPRAPLRNNRNHVSDKLPILRREVSGD